ncbi:nucleotide sugar dehydrogenase [uncultured Reyranella sp.]|uniref:nucleotide sugar dehydrogenase n=1 Tax=uncultured Reyranella sp. TaxID=735512 RepID=UPI0025D70E46|nr:nucleotide sugar dehydrogenase [uncultured Reyranella sp.]
MHDELGAQTRGQHHGNAPEAVASIVDRLRAHRATIGIMGLGYVGLPLACTVARKGFAVLGFDIDTSKVAQLNAGTSYISHIDSEEIAEMRQVGRLEATDDFSRLGEVDVIIMCVPTPLTKHREPDLTYVTRTTESIAPYLRRGQLVVLESTTYPGTTRDVLRPILERNGLRSGRDFFLAYSPEREDPGNAQYSTAAIPKVVGGEGPDALRLACALYDEVVARTVPVTSLETAEAVKLTENIFRSVNIALANELKTVYEAMGIDVWEVIEAAKSKPFGFMPFYPGPGLGGHCIPIDPFYLTWKAREYGVVTRFIELAGEINTAMPQRVVDRTIEALNERLRRASKGARVLVSGIAYKKNVDDTRESPAFKIIELLEKRGAEVSYYDPMVAEIPSSREHPEFAGRRSVSFTESSFSAFDAVVICTDHDSVDYEKLVEWSPLVIDTRNVCARFGASAGHVVKA